MKTIDLGTKYDNSMCQPVSPSDRENKINYPTTYIYGLKEDPGLSIGQEVTLKATVNKVSMEERNDSKEFCVGFEITECNAGGKSKKTSDDDMVEKGLSDSEKEKSKKDDSNDDEETTEGEY